MDKLVKITNFKSFCWIFSRLLQRLEFLVLLLIVFPVQGHGTFASLIADDLKEGCLPVVAQAMPLEDLDVLLSYDEIPDERLNFEPVEEPYMKCYVYTLRSPHLLPDIIYYVTRLIMSDGRHPESSFVKFIGLPGTKWLFIIQMNNPPPYTGHHPYPFEFADEKNSMFQIKDDPLDNRLNTDLELLYEDLSLMVEHRPNWADVPMDDLKTDFGKQVLEHLLEEPDPAPQESPQP